MEACKDWQQKRMARQLFMSIGFLLILFSGWQYPLLGYFIPLCMLLGIAMGFKRGRKWCDWYCPRGSFYDVLLSKASLRKKIPAIFKKISFRLGVLIFLMSVMTYNLVRRWPDPYKMGAFFVTLLTISTIVGVLLAVIFHQRSWCMICPIGTLVNLTGKNKNPLKINSELCIECKLCAKICPVQLEPYLYKGKGLEAVKERDCLKCGLCVSTCPKKALSF
jgi:polyferredoxin